MKTELASIGNDLLDALLENTFGFVAILSAKALYALPNNQIIRA